MKRLKLTLLTLLMPLVAFATEPATQIVVRNNSTYEYETTSALTAVKGKNERDWRFEAVKECTEGPGCSNGWNHQNVKWTVTQKPDWLALNEYVDLSRNYYQITFSGIVPKTAENTTLKLKIEVTGEDAVEKTFNITVQDPAIQYRFYDESEHQYIWKNETALTVIKGKYESFSFQTSSELRGIWEEVSPLPDWLRGNFGRYSQREVRIYGLVPEYAEDASFQIRVTDDSGSVATKTYNINVQTPAAPTITTTTLPNGEVGDNYSASLTTSSIYAEWSKINGSLPPGLLLEGSYIYGYPTTAGTYDFTVKAHNITGDDTKELSITIAAATEKPEFDWTSGCDDEYDDNYDVIGKICNVEEGASNVGFYLNRAATSVSVVSGSLPSGITIKRDQDAGVDSSVFYIFSGNLAYKTTGSNTYTFEVQATNSAGSNKLKFTFNVTQAEEAPVIGEFYDNYPDGVYVGADYESWLQLDNYVGATWNATGLPGGLALHPRWDGAYIKGAPTTAGNFQVTVKATNSKGSSTKTFTIKVLQPKVPNITTTSPLTEGKVGIPYEEYIEANTEFAAWRIVSGSLPPGLTLESDGYGYSYIGGIPTTIGTYTFTVEAKNAAGTKTKAFTIVIKTPALPTITTTELPDAKKGTNYHECIEAADDALWSKTAGFLPSGLTLESNGCIYGTPSAAITANTSFTFTVKAQNVSGSATEEFTIKVVNPPAPTITTEPQLSGKVGQNLWIGFGADEYVTSWNITESTLPVGLSFSSIYGKGRLEGRATEVGTYTFKLTATNAGGTSEAKTFTLTIAMPAAPVISISSLPNGKVGQLYEQALSAGDDASWDIASGSLPSGLVLESSDLVLGFDGDEDIIVTSWMIKGTPTTAGTKTFTLRATNVSGSATKSISITIAAASSGGGTTPILEITSVGNISVHTTANAILLSNLPPNAKVEAYNLQGKQIYSTHSENSQILRILVQTKGMYVVKIGSQSLRVVVR